MQRTAAIFPERTALLYADWKAETPVVVKQTWGETVLRVNRLASALSIQGVGRGDVVAVLSPNTPAFVELHHGVNASGAAINPLNTRLDVDALAYILQHSEAKVLLVDTALGPVASAAVAQVKASGGAPPMLVDLVDPIDSHHPEGITASSAPRFGALNYEELLEMGDEGFEWLLPHDEWETQAINYTSGTTGRPKGVLYSHRGAALNSVDQALVWGMAQHPTYLWTLPMFHCNGWTFPGTVTLMAGTHVCLRTVESKSIFGAIQATGVTHLCGAPIVMSMLVNAPADLRSTLATSRSPNLPPVKMFTAGAPPPAPVIQGMEKMGVEVTHVYGLTETYGPAVSSPWKEDLWGGKSDTEKAVLKARQGVSYPLNELSVHDEGGHPVPPDATTIGEIVLRGNIVMKGYLKDEAATEEAFQGGWFHSGDLAVVHPDGYVQIKDRAKDIVISGGENISTHEVESCLFSHPLVLDAAVVARPDDTWGETPMAFIELKAGVAWVDSLEAELIAFCRDNMAHFKCPKHVVHMAGGLPKTSTGKVQKFELRTLAKAAAALA